MSIVPSVVSGTQSPTEQIQHLPDHILLSVARNPSSSREFSKAAVKLLVDMKSRHVGHPDLQMLVAEIRRESEAQTEVEAIVESAIEQEIPSPMRASVTTATMFQDPIIRNADELASDALSEDFEAAPVQICTSVQPDVKFRAIPAE